MRSAKDVDTRADIWSLGAMLYEMLTGQPPYMAESIPQLCAALLHDDPVPLRQHRPEIPEGLEQAVLRCLMKDREHRFPSVFELGRALLPYGTPEGRFHVERAERVLGVKDATLNGLPIGTSPSWSHPMSSAPAMSVPITPLAVTPSAVMNAPTPPPPIADPTINSWGQSGLHSTPSRRGPILVVGLLAAVAAAAIGLWVARGQDNSSKPPAAAPSIDAPKADTKTPEPVLAPTPSVSPVAATPPAPSVTAATAPEPVAPSIAAPKSKPGVVSHAPAKKQETPAAVPPPPPPTSKPGGVTDFGGRR
jgi:serine/threonine-protein kinase